ncbi:hypothetical protein GCU56_14395 [Geodermatophilus sabuli]|uniref:O-antigen ligase family protein n=1 Tax=Geodermatophilus sabuli TaxID=1564158 RepID=A0A7K3W347_9ACTN|nr:hypothetical protein [Geodermatophilus sabuli]NEK59058.1 hypothetical protein [Geodermatophilus sabuli]
MTVTETGRGTAVAQPVDPTPAPRTRRSAGPVVLCAGAAVLAGGAAALLGAVGALVVAGFLLVVVVALHPVAAVYVYLVTLPFLAGIDRDVLIPFARPNEALLALLLAGAATGGYLRFVRGDEVSPRLRPLDVPLAVFVLLSTLWPVSWLLLRGLTPGGDDLTAVLPICKLVALLVLVRATVRTDTHRLWLVRAITWPAAVLGVIAVLQTAGVSPVVALLQTYWLGDGNPDDLLERGTTTLASPIATGDYVVLALALLVAMGLRGLVGRRELIVLGLPLVAGAFAAGQFSTWASAAVVGAAMLYQHRHLRRLALRLLPLLVLAALAGMPAFLARLSQFGDGFGVPRSWLGRWDNLTTFYLPGLGDSRWVLGVGPNSVLPAPETWRELIYLEYGYLQFLWVGGIPLLLGFVWLSVHVFRHARRVAARPDAAGAFGSALWAAWWMVLVLSLIDIHLVLRGAGDLLFVYLAVVGGRSDDR